MLELDESYIVDSEGNRISVILGMSKYKKLLSELEELESMRAYDAAKASTDESIPFQPEGLK